MQRLVNYDLEVDTCAFILVRLAEQTTLDIIYTFYKTLPAG